MTVTVSLPGEKPSLESPAMAPAAPELHTGTAQHWYNNPYLKSKCGLLKVAEIAFGLLALVLISQSYWLSIIEHVFIFLSINACLLTAATLWANLNGEKLRNVVRSDVFWEKLELHYNAIMALLYYLLSYCALAAALSSGYYNPTTKILAGVFGMFAGIAYAFNWWLLYRERL